VNCGKRADRIWMLFGVVSGARRRMAVLVGVEIVVREEAALGVNMGHAIATSGDFVMYSLP